MTDSKQSGSLQFAKCSVCGKERPTRYLVQQVIPGVPKPKVLHFCQEHSRAEVAAAVKAATQASA